MQISLNKRVLNPNNQRMPISSSSRVISSYTPSPNSQNVNRSNLNNSKVNLPVQSPKTILRRLVNPKIFGKSNLLRSPLEGIGSGPVSGRVFNFSKKTGGESDLSVSSQPRILGSRGLLSSGTKGGHVQKYPYMRKGSKSFRITNSKILIINIY